ncbi:MAG: hypothetical protein GYB67_13885, partial [Chloroflexi bacterium]|nr:hypothetical protein [Chloroflexota bacterium]
SQEPHVPQRVIEKLRRELVVSPLPHEVFVLEGCKRDFFTEPPQPDGNTPGARVLKRILAFMEKHLGTPRPPAAQQIY